MSLEAMASALEAEGFDVSITDVIAARREDGGGVWEVVVDRDGQLKATITRHSRKPTAKSRRVAGHRLRILTERLIVVTMTTQLQGGGEVAQVLAVLAKAVSHSSDQPTPTHRPHRRTAEQRDRGDGLA